MGEAFPTKRIREPISLYPCWDRFQKLRQDLDPDGLFMNEHLAHLFEKLGVTSRTEAIKVATWWNTALPVWLATAPVCLPMLSGCCFLMRREVIDRIKADLPIWKREVERTDDGKERTHWVEGNPV